MGQQNLSPTLFIDLATKKDLPAIIELQRLNLGRNLAEDEKKSQGFVSVETPLELLTNINSQEGVIVARLDEEIIGYIVRMTKEDASTIPLLKPFIARFPNITFKGKALTDYNYCILGQVCIKKEHRGNGLLEKLYKEFQNRSVRKYELAISEIGANNPRSLYVHLNKVGFEVIEQYSAEGQDWFVVILNLV